MIPHVVQILLVLEFSNFIGSLSFQILLKQEGLSSLKCYICCAKKLIYNKEYPSEFILIVLTLVLIVFNIIYIQRVWDELELVLSLNKEKKCIRLTGLCRGIICIPAYMIWPHNQATEAQMNSFLGRIQLYRQINSFLSRIQLYRQIICFSKH